MATPTMKEPMVKINLYIPKPFKDWLEIESTRTGLSQSALIHMALKTYIDQQKSMEMLPKLMKVFAAFKGAAFTGQEIDLEEMEKFILNISKALED